MTSHQALLNRVKDVRKGYEVRLPPPRRVQCRAPRSWWRLTAPKNRKIIWICHSMGGVVLKQVFPLPRRASSSLDHRYSRAQALIDAKIHARFNSIRDDTAGIIFMGTPHQGSGIANLGAIVASIVSSAMPGARIFNRDVLKDLKKNNNTLFGISSQFQTSARGFLSTASTRQCPWVRT